MNADEKRKIVLAKEGEKYVFSFDEASQKALLGTFGRFAASPELNFSWHDAAVLTKKVRQELQQAYGCVEGPQGEPPHQGGIAESRG